MAVNLKKQEDRKLPEITPVHIMTEEESMQKTTLPEITPIHLTDEEEPIQPSMLKATPITAGKEKSAQKASEKSSRFSAIKDFIFSIDDEIITLVITLILVIILGGLLVVVLQPLLEDLIAMCNFTTDTAESVKPDMNSLIQHCRNGFLLIVVFVAVGLAIASIKKLLR